MMERAKCGERKDLLMIKNIKAHCGGNVMAWACMDASEMGSVSHDGCSRINLKADVKILSASLIGKNFIQ